MESKTAHPARPMQELVLTALFAAIILLMAFTPLGLIDLPLIKATILHVPVIIGSVVLGPKRGAGLGALFGLVSLWKNTMAPSLPFPMGSPSSHRWPGSCSHICPLIPCCHPFRLIRRKMIVVKSLRIHGQHPRACSLTAQP